MTMLQTEDQDDRERERAAHNSPLHFALQLCADAGEADPGLAQTVSHLATDRANGWTGLRSLLGSARFAYLDRDRFLTDLSAEIHNHLHTFAVAKACENAAAGEDTWRAVAAYLTSDELASFDRALATGKEALAKWAVDHAVVER